MRYHSFLPFFESLKNVNFSNNNLVLELGCADGPFLPTLNSYAKKVVATDISERFITKSNILVNQKQLELRKINLIRADGLALPFRGDKFSLIFCLEVMEHVKNPKQMVEEIHRVLEDNGNLICSIPVEIGFSLLIKTIISALIKYKRPNYTVRELFQSIFLRRPGPRSDEMEHKNFDWRVIRNLLQINFKKVLIKFIPINFLRDFNPLILLKYKKTARK